jgi:hypothetical protein
MAIRKVNDDAAEVDVRSFRLSQVPEPSHQSNEGLLSQFLGDRPIAREEVSEPLRPGAVRHVEKHDVSVAVVASSRPFPDPHDLLT